MKFEIHPSIGVARVGNSPADFYLAPPAIGGLPLECDEHGNQSGGVARRFKDSAGRMRRQAAQFRVFRYDENDPAKPPIEVTLDTPDIVEMKWTVHLANKKPCWYEFFPLIGDDMLSPKNTYKQQKVDLRNKDFAEERRKLIIDPGPRELKGRRLQVDFSPGTIGTYPHASFPKKPTQGHWVRTLGEMRTDDSGRLIVLGGFGHAGGNKSIASFAGADTWNDDISDGPIACTLQLKDGSTHELRAWVIVGAPKVAPELVNLVTLDDVVFDVAVRFQNLLPGLCWRDPKEKDPYKAGVFNPAFRASYKTDIEPIIRRPLDYLWVANIPSMAAFGAPLFDPGDNSEQNRDARKDYFRYFRKPGWDATGQHNDLFLEDDHGAKLAPLMPLNSGSNSVRTNDYIDKFLTLSETQYFLFQQWAEGKFDRAERPDAGWTSLDRPSVGNCVGSPMCPGIEVTWNFRNPKIFASPYRIRFAHDEAYYAQHGLDPAHDETSGSGCEPGDLTKRMAIPWQADFFNCTAQFINFTDTKVNKDDNLIPVPPTYYSYWWPPQSPMYVISSQIEVEDQRAAGVMAGYPVYYQRGINTYAEAIEAWSYLAFIVNQNVSPNGRSYGYFVEQERGEEKFIIADVALGGPGNLINPEDQNFTPFWSLRPASVRRMQMLALDADAETGEAVKSPVRTDRR
jgi:L-lysine 6-oxidase